MIEDFKTVKRVFAILCLFIIGTWTTASFVAVINYTNRDSIVVWDGEKDYPIVRNTNEEKIQNKIKNKIKKIENNAEKVFEYSHDMYYSYVLASKWFDRWFYNYNLTTSLNNSSNKAYDSQDVVVAHETGELSFLIDDYKHEYPVESTIGFHNYLDNKDIPFLLLFTPMKEGVIDSSYKGIYIDYRDKVNQEICDKMSNAGVHVIDYNEIMCRLDPSTDSFYSTDHHWLPQTGLKACEVLSEYLNDDYGFVIDDSLFKEEKYQIEYGTIPMLGSQGKKVTSVYCDYEYNPILHPLYDSNLTVFNSKLNTCSQGTIEETLFDYTQMEEGNPYIHNQYKLYGYGSIPLIQMHNNLKNDGKRILVIKESFANCMIPFMSNMAEDVDAIDLRHFKGSIKAYIDKNKPDAVIMIYGISGFSNYETYKDNPSIDPFNFD